MISIFFLEKYGLTHKVARTVSDAGFSLIDFLIIDNTNIYSKQLTNSNRDKVFSAIQKWFLDDKVDIDIFDNVIMLNATNKSVPAKAFQLNESINGLKKIIEIQAIEEKGLSVTSSKINQLIAEYESLITNSDEIKIWEAFCYLIKNTKISIQDIETQQLDLEKFLELEKMNLIFVEGEIRYLNINNLFEKDFFINYFKIDKNMIPMKEDVIEKLSLNDYLKIDFKDKDLFLQRINGLTLQEIGDKKGLTKERVRQRLAKIRKNLPALVEVDTFGELYQEYDISKDLFINVFNQDERIYNLLSFLFSKGEKDITEKILNEEYSQKSKEYVLNASRRVQIGTDVKIATKENALVEVMKENKDLQTHLSKDEMFYLYNEYVQIYPKLLINNQRSLNNMADRSPNIIKSFSKGYRFFEFDLSDDILQSLKNIITELPPGAYNMEYVYTSNKEFMKRINILDGSELHNLYLKFDIRVPNMSLGRNPEFIFDINSKKEFIFQEMIPYHGKSVDEFADYLNNNFGLHKQSIKAYLSIEFIKYIKNKTIFIDSEDYSNIKNILDGILIDEIYLHEDFEKIIKEYTNLTKISPFLINQLGFRARGTLVIDKKYSSAKNAMISNILSRKIFSTEGERIYKTNDFNTALYSLEKEFKILKIGDDKYLNTSILKNRGFDFDKFHNFFKKIDSAIEYNAYFTIKSLLNSGFSDDLIDDGFELITLDRLIFTSDIFKPVTKSFPTLYHKGDKKFVNDFLLDSLLEYVSVNIEDFTDDINDKYGLNFEEENIKYRLLQEEIFYSKELNKVYIYKDDYLDEVYGK